MSTKLDKILSIRGVRDYYDDGDIDKEEFNKLKSEIESSLKLERLVKKRIILLEKELDEIAKTHDGTRCSGSDYNLKILNERNYYQTLLDESRKTVSRHGFGEKN